MKVTIITNQSRFLPFIELTHAPPPFPTASAACTCHTRGGTLDSRWHEKMMQA
ncbi:hypothetical protein M426DRAFT_320065 [Hypoxylon sp. CI-4A]|nr:hypothetical protein M426DRAFT_320065 [Hypoxylon sp. CI-4A]